MIFKVPSNPNHSMILSPRSEIEWKDENLRKTVMTKSGHVCRLWLWKGKLQTEPLSSPKESLKKKRKEEKTPMCLQDKKAPGSQI